MAPRLCGKVTIVSGAAGGIGGAICEKFAQEEATVVLVDRNESGLTKFFEDFTKKHGSKHMQACGDTADQKFAEDLFQKISVKHGSPGDVLVNCAGINNPCPFMDITEDVFDETIRVNLKGTFVMTKAYTSALKITDGMKNASIINIASVIGKAGYENYADYCASKSGIVGLTKTVGIELGRFGIRCNAVLPGIIETQMIDMLDESMRQHFAGITPMRRLGRPEDIANACLYLASDESSFVTCSCLEVTGGWLA